MKGQIHVQKGSLNHNIFSISRDLGRDKYGNNFYFIANVTVNPDGWIYNFRVGESITDRDLERIKEGVNKLLPNMESTDIKHFVAFV